MVDALPVFKALGDDTRFAIYQELAQSPAPCSAAELAERLTLHPNTVRPHLDRMREAGLVEVEPIHRGTVGRPQLRYSLAPGAPGLGLRPAGPHAPGRAPGRPGRAAGRRRARRRQPRPAVGHRSRRPPPERPGLPGRPGGRARPPRVRPGRVGARGRRRQPAGSASISSTAPSGSWPRPIRSWSAASTGGSSRAWWPTAPGGPTSGNGRGLSHVGRS